MDVLESISRLAPEISTEHERQLAGEVRKLIAAYREAEDLINIGAYVKGSSPLIDRAISLHEPIDAFLAQKVMERSEHSTMIKQLSEILGQDAGVENEEIQIPA